jgi:hypothetical protein
MAATREFCLIDVSWHAFWAKATGERDRVFAGRARSDRPHGGVSRRSIRKVNRLPVWFTPGQPER